MKKNLFRLGAIFLSLGGIVLGGEILIRLIPPEVPPAPASPLPWRQHSGYQTYVANTNFTIANERGVNISMRTDADGLRMNGKAPHSESGRVLVLGDSFVEAANTPAEQAFCSRLQALLPGDRMICINGGIGGASNFQAYLLMQRVFDVHKPQLVVLMVYLGNDLRDNYWAKLEDEPPGASASTLDNHAGILRRLLSHSRLIPLAKSFLRKQEVSVEQPFEDYFKSEIYTYETRPNEWVLEALRKTRRILGMMSGFCAERQVKFVVFGIPSKAQVEREFRQIGHFERSPDNKNFALGLMKDPDAYSFDRPSEYYEAMCREMGIPYHSMLSLFRENQLKKLYGDIDVHWNAAGQALGASFVAEKLVRDGVFPSKSLVLESKGAANPKERKP